MNWRHGLTPEEIRDAEMNRGAEVAGVKHGAAADILARAFDPDYVPPKPTHEVHGKAYNRQLRERNKNRRDFK